MRKPAVYDLVVETKISPDRLVTAATDFSERRPDVWPGITQSSTVFSRSAITTLRSRRAPVQSTTDTGGVTMVSFVPRP